MPYLHVLVSYLRHRQRYLWGTYWQKEHLMKFGCFPSDQPGAKFNGFQLRLCTITATYLESVLEVDVFVTFVANLFRLAIT